MHGEPFAEAGSAGRERTAAREPRVAELSIVEAVNDCLHVELARDDNVLVLGEDVGRAGGVFRATAGLRDRFGPDRCVDTPLAEAKGLLAAAIRDPDPVVVLEPKLHYRTIKGEVPEGEHVVPLGKARVVREGNDVTLVAYGSMLPLCELAADALDRTSVEILDVRTLKPLDEEALLASVAKTGRVVIVQEAPRTAGYGAELAAIIAEKAIYDLQGPVLRVTGYDVPYPYWQIEDAYMPSVARVVDAARKLLQS